MDCDRHSDEVINVACVAVAMSRICSSKYKGVSSLSKGRS